MALRGPARPASADAAGDLPGSRRNAIVTAAQRASPAVVSVSVVATRVVRADPTKVRCACYRAHNHLAHQYCKQCALNPKA